MRDGALAGTAATLLAFAVAAAALVLCVRLAPRAGLLDDGRDAPARKCQPRAVPLAGGPALVAAAVVLVLSGVPHGQAFGSAFGAGAPAGFAFQPWAVALAAGLAFTTGLVDDRRAAGLPPLGKLAGQCAAGVALASGLELGGEPAGLVARGLAVLAAVTAQNVANTFDHADGMLGTLTLAGFLAARASFAGALAAFLCANLTRPARGGPPHAYLGDSGAHLVAILLLASPVGPAVLTLPALDLARVVVLRVRARQPIWIGDRRHLGQRLADGGRGPVRAALLGLGAAVPALAAHLAAQAGLLERGVAFPAGAAGSALLLGVLLRLHPAR